MGALPEDKICDTFGPLPLESGVDDLFFVILWPLPIENECGHRFSSFASLPSLINHLERRLARKTFGLEHRGSHRPKADIYKSLWGGHLRVRLTAKNAENASRCSSSLVDCRGVLWTAGLSVDKPTAPQRTCHHETRLAHR